MRKIEHRFWGNGYTGVVVDGKVIYKSKDIKKVTARYEHMLKLETDREMRKPSNPYKIGGV